MNLYVDIGNTTINWATADDLAVGTAHQAYSSDLPASIVHAWQQMVAPRRVYISSVLADKRTKELIRWISRYWHVKPVMAETKAEQLGVINGYRLPSQLGVDRWLALLAARALSEAPLIVVDCGSATTLDAMDGKGQHLGGVILPGLRLFQRCLLANTDLPPIEESEKIDYFATDTATGIASGAMLATASSVEWMLEVLRKRCGSPAECLVTGGNATLLSGYLTSPHRIAPNLILQGLALMAGRKD